MAGLLTESRTRQREMANQKQFCSFDSDKIHVMTARAHSNQDNAQTIRDDLALRYLSTLDQIREQIRCCRRPEGSMKLIAVSKQHPAEAVATVAKLGQRDFGENYVQESLSKIQAVTALLGNRVHSQPLCWHFVGHVQSRKCKDIAQNFDWVHTIDSPKIAQRLDAFRNRPTPLQSLIQVNLQNEFGKSGVQVDELSDLADVVDDLPNLALKGLMIIPRPESDFARQRKVFQQLRELLETYQSCRPDMDQLSMGMTNDMAAAICEGTTMVRIGTAIFGPRKPIHKPPVQ